MVFLFVGSSALTEASFPRHLAVPQLLLSSAWAMLILVMRASLTVYPHRGLSPHQFIPMSGAHKAVQRTGASRFAQRQIERHRRLAPVADLCVGYEASAMSFRRNLLDVLCVRVFVFVVRVFASRSGSAVLDPDCFIR